MPHLKDLPNGITLFLDANIFLEHLISGEPNCTVLFQRLRSREIQGITSVLVLAEVRHRLLLTEAVRRGYVPSAVRALQAVKKHPGILSHLSLCDTALNDIVVASSIRILNVTSSQFRAAQRLSLRHHLLTNDAFHIAAMRSRRIHHLASADQDFRRVPRLTLWHP